MKFYILTCYGHPEGSYSGKMVYDNLHYDYIFKREGIWSLNQNCNQRVFLQARDHDVCRRRVFYDFGEEHKQKVGRGTSTT